jgi:hypothetical protein
MMGNKIHRLILIALVGLACALGIAAQRVARPDLHSRAKSNGGKLVWKYKPTRSVIYPTVEELFKRTDIVIVGRTLGHRGRLTPDGKFVTEDFLVRVQEVLKGNVQNGSSILISLPGGSYKFPDGAHVHVMAVGYKQAIDGVSYVFFLKDNKNTEYKGYRLASDTQGLFALKDRKVEPAYTGASDPIATKNQGVDAITFIRQLRAAVPVAKK